MKFVKTFLRTISCLIGIFWVLVAISVLVEDKGVRSHENYVTSLIFTPIFCFLFLWLGLKKSKAEKLEASIASKQVPNTGFKNNKGEAQNSAIIVGLLVLLVSIFIPVALGFAVYGSRLGLQRKIVVYDSVTDLNITCASVMLLVGGIVAFCFRAEAPFVIWIGWALLIPGIIFTFNTITRSSKANATHIKGMLSVLAKYALLGLITCSAFITIGAGYTALEEAKKKNYKKAVANAATAAVGAAAFCGSKSLINRLITENE